MPGEKAMLSVEQVSSILLQFGNDLDKYASAHGGHYPPSFKAFQLEMYDAQHPGPLGRIQMNGVSFDNKVSSFDNPTCPDGLFVYIGRIWTTDSLGNRPLIYERPQPGLSRIPVLQVDHTVCWMGYDEAEEVFAYSSGLAADVPP